MADEKNNPSNEALVATLAMGAGTLGDKIANIGTDMARTDQQMQIQHLLGFIQPVMGMDNVVWDQVESMPEGFDDLVRHSESPAVANINGQRFAFQETEFDFEMEVGSHTEAQSATSVGVKSETEVGAAWMGVSAKQSLAVDVSHESKNTRTTDMTARMRMKAKMYREQIPEGLAKGIDQAIEFSRVANQLRLQIVGAKIAAMQEKIRNGEVGDANAVEQAAAPEGAE